MLSFALGLVDLTTRRVGDILAACSAVAPPVAVEPASDGVPINLGQAARGFLSEAAGGLARTPALARARARGMAESARRRAAPLHRVRKLVSGLPGMPRAVRRLSALRERGRHQLARWAEVGRREQAQSRILAVDALTVLRENMLPRVAESPDVKSVIREQSTGIAATAMGELRERSARADNLVERTIGRLLHDGRTPRTP